VSLRDRRFFVRDVSDHRVGQRAYFNAIVEEMENGGLAAMLCDLLHRDLSGFEFRDIPETAARKDQQTLSLPSPERWWLAVLSRRFVWRSRHGTPWFATWAEEGIYTTELLWRSYIQWCDDARPTDRVTRELLGMFLTRLYQPTRPRAAHPVGEIENIDLRRVSGIRDSKGEYIEEPEPLDKIAIARSSHQPCYRVGELDEARARFLDQCPVVNPWSEPE
jgi:hypothetical protein